MGERGDKRTVYAVVSGCYSDYSVSRIFECREDAEAFIQKMGNFYEIVEFDFHPTGCLPEIYTEYRATIRPHYESEIEVTAEMTLDKPRHLAYERGKEDRFYFGAVGPDRERVVKSVSDRLAAWKARQEGVA